MTKNFCSCDKSYDVTMNLVFFMCDYTSYKELLGENFGENERWICLTNQFELNMWNNDTSHELIDVNC